MLLRPSSVVPVVPVGPRWPNILVAVWLAAWAWPAAAAPEPAASTPGITIGFSADVSIGRESNRLPRVTVSEDNGEMQPGPIERIALPVWRTAAMGSVDVPLTGLQRLTGNWRIDQQRSGGGNSLGYRMLAADVHWGDVVYGVPLSVGPGVQELQVSGTPFRRTVSLEADLTLQAGGSGIASLMGSVGRYRHPSALRELDATAWSLTAFKRWNGPWGGFESLDLDVGIRGERNRQHIAGLSSTGVHARASVDRKLGEWLLAVGVMWQSTRYDGGWLEHGPARRDAFTSWDLSAVLPLRDGWQLRLATTSAQNRANLPLFFQKSQGWTLSLGYAMP